ncbi:hypothetical protein K491DRAFT_207317 [Lophiostoma macrostomum CBS 122681]|uniref:Dynamin GTPase domain-containing protein n=1 Tax=Lophiostoma macrostomum CBS 122681 TaxID=1314788 RepID=A0A6A6TJD6_9PLEO|nr:hypothetical protein K491DRAFT_207317 [Lophiostoma macrostomum CBS 122681]
MDDLNSAFNSTLYQAQIPLLDAIDKVRGHRASFYDDIQFPQWVVVGDQNTGKSSVMEAICRVHFPIHDGLCTRYPIQLELRNSKEKAVLASIIPGLSRTAHEKSKLQAFQKKLLDISELQDVVREAGLVMGISTTVTSTAGRTNERQFSDDLLRIFVSGPEIPSLAMLDLPGLYQTQSKDQDASGKTMVTNLVKKYMQQKNSIILLVVSARNDFENHVGPSFLPKEAQKRTLAVLTRPDDAADPDRPLQIVKGLVDDQSLTWHCLRNLSSAERKQGKSLNERDRLEEEFFDQPHWQSIPSHQKGIGALQKKLSYMLHSAIERELPRVMSELNKLINVTNDRRRRLGEPRATSQEQIEYLSDMAHKFEKCVTAATAGEYDRFPELFGDLDTSSHQSSFQNCKLRANMRELNRVFRVVMDVVGKTMVIHETLPAAVISTPQVAPEDIPSVEQENIAPFQRHPHWAGLAETLSQGKSFLKVD